MTTQNVSLVIMKAEELAALTSKMQQLEWRAAGYDRMKAVCDQQKGRIAELENRVASSDEKCPPVLDHNSERARGGAPAEA